MTSADFGKSITVQAVYKDKEGQAESPTSNALSVQPKPGNHAPTGEVRIDGDGKLGSLLSASNDLSDPDGPVGPIGTITYKWFAKDSTGAVQQISAEHYKDGDASRLVVSSDLLGRSVSVEASYVDGQGNSERVSVDEAKTRSISLPDSFSLGTLNFASNSAGGTASTSTAIASASCPPHSMP